MESSVPIFVVNLDRRPDRLESITENLDRLGLKAERVPAIDANEVTVDELRTRVNLDSQLWTMGRGSESNILSHCRAIEMFLSASSPAALILEDDAELASDLRQFVGSRVWWPDPAGLVKLEAYGPKDVFFGRECARRHRGRQFRPISLWSGGSAGYMIDRDAAEIVLARCRNVPISIDHVLFDLRVSPIARRLRPVQVLPGLVRQRVDEFESDVAPLRHEVQPIGLRRRWQRLRCNCRAMPRKAAVKGQRLCGLAESALLDFADTISDPNFPSR